MDYIYLRAQILARAEGEMDGQEPFSISQHYDER